MEYPAIAFRHVEHRGAAIFFIAFLIVLVSAAIFRIGGGLGFQVGVIPLLDGLVAYGDVLEHIFPEHLADGGFGIILPDPFYKFIVGHGLAGVKFAFGFHQLLGAGFHVDGRIRRGFLLRLGPVGAHQVFQLLVDLGFHLVELFGAQLAEAGLLRLIGDDLLFHQDIDDEILEFLQGGGIGIQVVAIAGVVGSVAVKQVDIVSHGNGLIPHGGHHRFPVDVRYHRHIHLALAGLGGKGAAREDADEQQGRKGQGKNLFHAFLHFNVLGMGKATYFFIISCLRLNAIA